MRKKQEKLGSGQQLVADFQTAFVSATTIEAAKYEAARSEDELVDQLTAVSNGAYLQPDAMNSDAQARITHDSLDAHIKKVQAKQLESVNAAQLNELITQTNAVYTNRKVQVTLLPLNEQAIESLWFNKYKGYRTGVIAKGRITGIIDEIVLDKNLLVLRPTASAQLFNSELQNYLVYVINPGTLMPAVELTLL